MTIEIVDGDLLDQNVEAIVNAWNRNIIPWWLLWPHGVSGAIKKRAGLKPFQEVAKHGPIPLGEGVLTSAGKLEERGVRAIIHVAGINAFWRASEYSIRRSVRSAITIACENSLTSLALPVIGAGAGGFDEDKALSLMRDELEKIEAEREPNLHVILVRYKANFSVVVAVLALTP